MSKESRYHSEQQDVIFYEPFIDEQTVRRNNGVPTAVSFSQGIGTFLIADSSNINYGTHRDGDMGLMGDLTFDIYLKPEAYAGCAYTTKLFTNGEFTVGFWGDPDFMAFFTSDEFNFTQSASGSVPFDEWIQVTITRTAAGVTNFYINRVLSGTADQDSGTPTLSDTDLEIVPEFFEFTGDIDRITIYRYVLSVEEIENLVSPYWNR